MQIIYEFVIKYIGVKFVPPPLKTTKPYYVKKYYSMTSLIWLQVTYINN
jgi:hypothetical protein